MHGSIIIRKYSTNLLANGIATAPYVREEDRLQRRSRQPRTEYPDPIGDTCDPHRKLTQAPLSRCKRKTVKSIDVSGPSNEALPDGKQANKKKRQVETNDVPLASRQDHGNEGG